MKKWMWFSSGLCVGLVSLSLAVGSVPKSDEGASLSESLSDDTVLYQDLSDIRVNRAKLLDFDGDIASLEAREKRYRERLPLVATSKSRHTKSVKKKRYRRSSRSKARVNSTRQRSQRYQKRTSRNSRSSRGVKARAARRGSNAQIAR